ncbi:MAG: hypothetical protein JOZ41_17515 [Chloroflexi bacterium]|nr:hypothetical protein [Chloroflexota bacterium]
MPLIADTVPARDQAPPQVEPTRRGRRPYLREALAALLAGLLAFLTGGTYAYNTFLTSLIGLQPLGTILFVLSLLLTIVSFGYFLRSLLRTLILLGLAVRQVLRAE